MVIYAFNVEVYNLYQVNDFLLANRVMGTHLSKNFILYKDELE